LKTNQFPKRLIVTVIVQSGGCSIIAIAFAAFLIQGNKKYIHEKSFGCCGENETYNQSIIGTKAFDEGYNFASNLTSIEGVHTKI
jgi:hypothetical protein